MTSNHRHDGTENQIGNQANTNEQKSIWYYSAIFLTVAYVALISFVVDITPSNIEPNRICNSGGWREQLFGCLTMNELGDFLAGTFAPLAFIWLAAAVLIQAEELRAQRNELKLTRISVDQNRKVMEAQVKESRKQADYIGQQTALLAQESQAREERKRIEIFDAAIGLLAGRIRDNPNFLNCRWHPPKTGPVSIHPLGVHELDLEEDRELIRATALASHTYLSNESRREDMINQGAILLEPEGFAEVHAACCDLLYLENDLPLSAKITFQKIGITRLSAELDWLARLPTSGDIDLPTKDNLKKALDAYYTRNINRLAMDAEPADT